MHVHIASVFKGTDPILQGVKGCNYIDKIYLLIRKGCPTPYTMVKNGEIIDVQEGINNTIDQLIKGLYTVETVSVDPFEYMDTILTIKKIYETETEKARSEKYKVNFSVNITTGTKIQAAAECVAANLISNVEMIYVIDKNEMADKSNNLDDNNSIENSIVRIPSMCKTSPDDLSDEECELLKIMLEKSNSKIQMTNQMIANDRFNAKKQNASYYLRKLENRGLVKQTDYEEPNPLAKKNKRASPTIVDKRSKRIELTETGFLYARWIH